MLTKYVCGISLKAQSDDQITDLLQLSLKENESRILCMNAFRHRHAWKKLHKGHEKLPTVYAKIEGVLLAKQVWSAIFFYKNVRRDRNEAFSLYIGKLPPQKAFTGGAR